MNYYRRAISDYDRAILLKRRYLVAYIERGVVHLRIRNLQEAIKDSDSALRINPYYSEACSNRGKAHRLIGDLQGAMENYQQAIDYCLNHSD
jgi:tetratricopeptide (TPR) repeat protein